MIISIKNTVLKFFLEFDQKHCRIEYKDCNEFQIFYFSQLCSPRIRQMLV
jgi:hypothetical protein